MRETCIWVAPIKAPIWVWDHPTDEAEIEHQAVPLAQAGQQRGQYQPPFHLGQARVPRPELARGVAAPHP